MLTKSSVFFFFWGGGGSGKGGIKLSNSRLIFVCIDFDHVIVKRFNVFFLKVYKCVNYSYLVLHCIDTQNFVLYLFTNQRTNGPVYAHLISGPTIGTKISFAKFDSRKIGLGQLRVLIYINFVKLEYIMLHAKFHDHRTISSVGKDF